MNIDKIDYSEYLLVAQEAATTAGKYLQKASKSRAKIISEPDRDIKLEADIESEKIIINILKGKSNFSILTEEQGSIDVSNDVKERQYKWIVDPLDGTMNFSRGFGICCVSIALWQDTNPVLGVVYDFNQDELFTGLVNQGAWLNGNPITASKVSKKSKAVLATGFPVSMDYSEKALLSFAQNIRKYKKIRMIGSAALSLAYVACGRFDIYFEKNIKIWDVAAGLALVKACSAYTNIKFYPNLIEVDAIGASNNHLIIC